MPMLKVPCPECGAGDGGIRGDHAESCTVPAWIEKHLATAPPLSRSTIRTIVNLMGPQ